MSSIAQARALTAVSPALLANVYIVGLNQLSDIEIDRVNKPELPLASGASLRARLPSTGQRRASCPAIHGTDGASPEPQAG